MWWWFLASRQNDETKAFEEGCETILALRAYISCWRWSGKVRIMSHGSLINVLSHYGDDDDAGEGDGGDKRAVNNQKSLISADW